MSRLLSKATQPDADGCIQRVTPEKAGWQYVTFEAYQLSKGETLSLPTLDKEVCLVLVTGRYRRTHECLSTTSALRRLCA